MRILHITNWYYSKKNPESVPFIKEHFDALQLFCDNKLIHVEVVHCKNSWLKIEKEILSKTEDTIIVYSRFAKIWRIKELLSHYTLLRLLKKINANQSYDLINIHTAYPLVTFTKNILSFLKIPLVFTEHWTAFHFNFNLPKNTKKLNRVKKIYNTKTPVITVSKALGNDIIEFCKNKSLINYVVPNVVNSEIFNFKNKPITKEPVFYMLNNWRAIKSPFILFNAFQFFLKKYPSAKLLVGGYGPLWRNMEEYIEKNNLRNNIILLGYQSKTQSSEILQGITAFIHAASYETFSVVNAEALMCGTPVIVSDIPAIKEYVYENNGIIVTDNSPQKWADAMEKITIENSRYDRAKISMEITQKFSKNAVGKLYFNTLQTIKNNFNLDLDRK